MPRHSKIQLQVLQLYKSFLRASESKPGVKDYVRSEFKKNAQIARTDTLRIEHIMRRSQRQLQSLKKSNVTSMGVFENEKAPR